MTYHSRWLTLSYVRQQILGSDANNDLPSLLTDLYRLGIGLEQLSCQEFRATSASSAVMRGRWIAPVLGRTHEEAQKIGPRVEIQRAVKCSGDTSSC